MVSQNQPTQTHVVLIGGGHSHAIALKLWGMNPIEGVRLTLISDSIYTPYSGMLPGHVGGFYSFEETHINLNRLVQLADAQFYQDWAIGLDLEKNQVICAKNSPLSFDYLSIDIGSTPATISVPGAADYAIPAKPVSQFLTAWNTLLQQVKNHPHQPITISIVGGGAGGVELALNIDSHLKKITQQATLHLFHRGKRLLSGHNHWVGHRLETLLQNRNISLHLSENVTQITPSKTLICESGLTVENDYIFG